MAIDSRLRHFFRAHEIGPCRILVAVSGGPDSTALLLGLHELRSEGFQIAAGHVNHGLRGAESDEDQAFVETLCRAHEIQLLSAPGDLAVDETRHLGIEAAARRVRYELLERMRIESEALFVATGHTSHDQAETLLMRFVTGRGLSRLQGIAPITSRHVIRPLLEAGREEVAAFLTDRKIPARHDSSNDDLRFLRNRIRHEIMPRLLEINPNLHDTLADTAKQVREQQAILDEVVRAAAAKWVVERDTSSIFLIDQAPSEPWLVQACLARQIRRLEPDLREVSSEDLRRLAAELGTLRRVTVSRRLELLGSGPEVTLRIHPLPFAPFELPLTPEVPVDLPDGRRVTVRRAVHPSEPAKPEFQLPAEQQGRFSLRSRRPGDRFHPSGRSRERSLSDFLIERRIPREVRDSIPLLTWNGRIVSVTGVEIAEAFKVRDRGKATYVVVLEDSP